MTYTPESLRLAIAQVAELLYTLKENSGGVLVPLYAHADAWQARVEALEEVRDAAADFVWAHDRSIQYDGTPDGDDLDAVRENAWQRLRAALAGKVKP
jgi:hypothetical protein